MKKRVLALVLASAMVFSLAACGSKETGNDQPAEETTQEEQIIEYMKMFLLEPKEKKVLKNQFKHIHFDYAISTFYHPWASTVLRCFDVRKKIIICHDIKTSQYR